MTPRATSFFNANTSGSTAAGRHRHRRGRGLSAACLALCLATTTLAAPPADEPDPWQLVRLLRFTEARLIFEGRNDSNPWQRLGSALALLNAPPKTRGRLAEARARFAELADADDRDLRVIARYYLARIAQVHAYEPDWAEARRLFQALLDEFPDHPLAQLGAAKIALLDLYDTNLDEPLAARFDRLAQLGERLSDPPARRDFHYVLGCAAIYHRMPDALALRHLLASRDAGLTNDVNRANVFIRIAETAYALGEADLAREHYTRFLKVAPRDVRSRAARERLAELGGPVEIAP